MSQDNRIISFLNSHEPDMFALLEKMVLIQSGSHNKEGVDRVARLIQSIFRSNTVSCQTMEQTKFGNHLIVRSLCKKPFDEQILMVGHMDTVFPKNTDFNWFRKNSTCCYGPGVIDMKGGLVVGIFVLKALDSLGLLQKNPITFIFNSDEEIGSPGSRDLIKSEAEKSACAFVLECSGLEGEVVTGRKGNLSVKLDVYGKSGHAAFTGKDKASAILELAHKTIGLESLNHNEKGITVNVGRIRGGVGPNTIPEHATAHIDFRYVEQKDDNFLRKTISKITARQKTPHTRADFEIVSHRPPMEQTHANRQLFQTVKTVAKRLGLPIKEEFRSGVSDANIIAEKGIPVLDGLGPIGAKDHSKDEYMISKSLLQRSILLACSIIELSFFVD
ncbi:MAG: M20 family metallopeptidase [Desulfobacterales bacterium]